ncbi:MAG: Acyltransferase family protein [Firmicutes bacterium ADurb.Bin467]|jgi:surface polysaccharide O-acyltransferase-like enzyme|nr:MAG: Acyltransferase family protein [Firmicutes bacterium ADurb.Bin467]
METIGKTEGFSGRRAEARLRTPTIERERDLGIDLLRVLAALMVIGAHVLNQGGALDAAWGGTENSAGAVVLQSVCMSSVNCFGITTGYMLCRSRFHLMRMLRLWSVVLFYGLLFTGLRLIVAPRAVTSWELLSAVLPVTFKRMWYVSAYFGLFFITPFLNRLLRSLNRKQHLALALVLLFLFSGIATISFSETFGINDRGHNVLWLGVLYIVGAYVRMHARPWPRRLSALLLIGAIAASTVSKYVIAWAAELILGRRPGRGLFIRDISPLIVLIALSLFYLLRGFSPKNRAARAAISFAAPLTFGVYVIHMQPMLWDGWERTFAPFAGMHVLVFPLAVLGAVFAIFAACMAIDFLRARVFRLMKIDSALAAIERRALSVWNWALQTAQRAL